MAWWTSTATPNYTIELGGETIEVKPLTLENSLRLLLLLGPYVVRLEDKWPKIRQALEATNGTRPGLLELLLKELRQEMAFAPGDIVTAFALCLDTDAETVARNARPADLINALPVLDAVNDFKGLWAASKALGITVKYGN